MKLLLSSLLLACLHALPSRRVSSGTPVATQTPDVSVMEGETVHITCCWTQEFERGRVNWLKNQTHIKTEILLLKDHFQGSSHCSKLTFKKITREDSGRYACRVSVEIPILDVFEGEGTVITVTARDNTEDNRDPPIADGSHWEQVLVQALRYLPILALVIAFFCLNNSATRAQRHTPGQDNPSS